jgi:2-oxoglutarate ferredoxin oxidoreductase subunit alpha
MQDFSILIGGQAGDGIRQIGGLVAGLLGRLGYHVFFWDDYPSLIRGGHNFSLIRACRCMIQANTSDVDLIVALNEDTVKNHSWRLKEGATVVYDADAFQAEGVGLKFTSIVKEAGGKPIMRNTAAFATIAKMLGLKWETLEDLVQTSFKKETETNLAIAKAAFEQAGDARLDIEQGPAEPLPLMTGNEAIALGAVAAGLDLYVAYPMTPSTSILHFLAAHEEDLGVVTYHPENEIAAAVTAIGGSYAGARTMVGSAGGGFALMVEAVSLAAQSEAPVVFVVSQRPGPSTGVPTYTTQGDLNFVLSAGHGEFLRFVVAPGDVNEAYDLTGLAMNMAWKYQIPAFVLTDKCLSESTYCFDAGGADAKGVKKEEGLLWDGKGEYKRYLDTDSGVSPLAFPGRAGAIVKGTSYEHDEYGITTEVPEAITAMQDKRMKKRSGLIADIAGLEAVKTYGDAGAETAILTWGSTKGACVEVAEALGLKVVQPVILEPFPAEALKAALKGVKKTIAVEVNVTGALAGLARCYGIEVQDTILKYDGRHFTVDELRERVEGVMK